MAVCGSCDAREWRENTQQGTLADRGGVSLREPSVVRWVGQLSAGRKWNGSQLGQGATYIALLWPTLRKMQGEAARRAGEPFGKREEPPPEGSGGHGPFAQAIPRRPAGQVMHHRLDGQPGAVGGEAPRGEMVQPDAVLEVSNSVLGLGVAAMISLQFEQLPVPVGDEAVIAVFGEESQLGTRRRLHPPDDEPYRRGVRLGLEGGAECQWRRLSVGTSYSIVRQRHASTACVRTSRQRRSVSPHLVCTRRTGAGNPLHGDETGDREPCERRSTQAYVRAVPGKRPGGFGDGPERLRPARLPQGYQPVCLFFGRKSQCGADRPAGFRTGTFHRRAITPSTSIVSPQGP